jgi:hypothetical protein
MVTSGIALEDVVQKGFEELVAHRTTISKSLSRPGRRIYNAEGAPTQPGRIQMHPRR